MIANLKAQGIKDITDIELAGGPKASVKDAPTEGAAVGPASPARPATAPAAAYGRRGAGGGKSSLVIG